LAIFSNYRPLFLFSENSVADAPPSASAGRFSAVEQLDPRRPSRTVLPLRREISEV
jgi:hypothetical protein